jgi:plastocyanin
MRGLLLFAFGIACALGIGTMAFAQGGIQEATPIAPTCASPAAGTPVRGTPTSIEATSVAATPTGCGTPSAAVSVEAVDLAFKPSDLVILANTPVMVTVHNGGVALHNFSVDTLGVSVDVVPGETKSVTINAPAGEYEFYCDVPGHKQAGMVGRLYIVQQ